MKKLAKKAVIASLIMSVSSQTMAAFTLSGTRFIYEAEKKNISFEVTNNAEQTYGGQIWVDNTNQDKDDVFIVPAPPFFKIKPKQKQIVRLLNVNNNLPKDRESLFWLNVQEIPPKPTDVEGSVLAIAMNTQVKLIYRPKGLSEARKDAEKQVHVVRSNGGFALKNPTPYFFAVVGLKQNGKDVKMTSEQNAALVKFAPFSEVSLGGTALGSGISIDAINDWGGVQTYDIK
ncbi:fimbrial chaperone [Aeromonas veronii]|uniref:fimbrial chaperone n=1 Tax=Aeromonas veronii TaxID=654 RepID=UPI0015FFAF42|nr:fimbrial chaperone [Aeromonas veronii]